MLYFNRIFITKASVSKMTELEKIQYAKSFMDKLANGINPLDDSPVPDEDIVNNVRISRCFFYVSDILRQVIENGGTKPTTTVHIRANNQENLGKPWTADQDEKLLTLYLDNIPIPEIAKRMQRSQGGIRARLKKLKWWTEN